MASEPLHHFESDCSKAAQKVMPVIFFLSKYLFLNHEITHYDNNGLIPLLIFPQSLRPLLQPCASEEGV